MVPGMRELLTGVNRFTWTVHNDPETHTVEIDNNKVLWNPKKSNQLPLTMFLLEPAEFAWESGTIQSIRRKEPIGKASIDKTGVVFRQNANNFSLVMGKSTWKSPPL